jgi:hypothetical protein
VHPAGALDSDTAAAKVLTEYEARIAAWSASLGKLVLENEFPLPAHGGTASCCGSASICYGAVARMRCPIAVSRGCRCN